MAEESVPLLAVGQKHLGHEAQLPLTMLALSSLLSEVVTPLNIVIVALFLFVVIYRNTSASEAESLPKPTPPVLFRTFTPPVLSYYNGEKDPNTGLLNPVYLGIRGRVFDVSAGRNFYGPGGPYANFAGRDATRGLACQSFDEEMLTKNLDGPLDDLNGLGQDEMENLQNWEETFSAKYLIVGKLVPAGSKEAQEAAAGGYN